MGRTSVVSLCVSRNCATLGSRNGGETEIIRIAGNGRELLRACNQRQSNRAPSKEQNPYLNELKCKKKNNSGSLTVSSVAYFIKYNSFNPVESQTVLHQGSRCFQLFSALHFPMLTTYDPYHMSALGSKGLCRYIEDQRSRNCSQAWLSVPSLETERRGPRWRCWRLALIASNSTASGVDRKSPHRKPAVMPLPRRADQDIAERVSSSLHGFHGDRWVTCFEIRKVSRCVEPDLAESFLQHRKWRTALQALTHFRHARKCWHMQSSTLW